MKTLTTLAGMLMLVTGAMLGGCALPPECPKEVAPMDKVISQYNANAKAVSWFAANAKISMTVKNEKGSSFGWGGTGALSGNNGKVFFARGGAGAFGPDYFALVGKEASRPFFWMGVSPGEQVYYVWYTTGKEGGAWVGQNSMAGSAGHVGMPIDPMGIVSLLNFTPLPGEEGPPAVMMTVEADRSRDGKPRQPCAYVLTYARREIYFHWTGPKDDFSQPYRVVFLGPDGRRMMTASLDNYKPVPGATRADGKPAMMPTDITIVNVPWPGVKTVLERMEIKLTDFTATKDEDRGDPMEAAKFQQNLPPTLSDRVHSIDQQQPTTQKGTE